MPMSFSRVLQRLRSPCRVRSLHFTVRSQPWNSLCLCAFRYRKPCCPATVPLFFVGGAPLICAPRHRHVPDYDSFLSLCIVICDNMSQKSARKSVRIHSPSYQPRMTWRLPEIVSVCFFFGGGIGDCYDTRVFIFILLKGVAPSSFVRPPHQHIETYPEDTAHSPTVCDHPDGRGDPHAMQQGLPSHVDTQTVAVSDNGAVHHGSSTHAPAGHHVLFCIARQPVFDTLPANNLDIMNIHCPFCGALHWLDERVSSSRAGHPQFGTCCAHGKVKLPFLRVPPAPLYNLYTGDTPQAKEFRANIVQYNVALAFTSLGVKVDRSVVGLAFGGFIDRIRRDRNVDKPISSMEIEIANIAYISNRPEPSPNREHPTIKFWSTHKTHTTAYRILHSSNNIANTMEL